eukprot:3783725-Pyramimonas_sp.AAC.1
MDGYLGCRVHPCRYWHRRTRKNVVYHVAAARFHLLGLVSFTPALPRPRLALTVRVCLPSGGVPCGGGALPPALLRPPGTFRPLFVTRADGRQRHDAGECHIQGSTRTL